MNPIHIKQKWNGTFSYLEGYELPDQYKEVEFTMDINISENSFVGISTDSESEKLFDKPATIKGFIEGDKISFIVKYSYSYFKNENGQLILDPTSEHPDIHYLGFFDDDKTEVNGNWEMTIYEEKYGDEYLEEVANGKFNMRKIK